MVLGQTGRDVRNHEWTADSLRSEEACRNAGGATAHQRDTGETLRGVHPARALGALVGAAWFGSQEYSK
jgi:hypothetical protein